MGPLLWDLWSKLAAEVKGKQYFVYENLIRKTNLASLVSADKMIMRKLRPKP